MCPLWCAPFKVCPLRCAPFKVCPLRCAPFKVCPLRCAPFKVCPLRCAPFKVCDIFCTVYVHASCACYHTLQTHTHTHTNTHTHTHTHTHNTHGIVQLYATIFGLITSATTSLDHTHLLAALPCEVSLLLRPRSTRCSSVLSSSILYMENKQY